MTNTAPVLTATLLLTLEQAADQLQISVRTLSRMAARGEVPVVRFGSRIVRIRSSTIENLLAEREHLEGAEA